MAEDSDLERTEPASARKLEQAREKGNVPRSRELATLAVLLASVGMIAFMGLHMLRGLYGVMHSTLTFNAIDVSTPAMMGRNLMEAGMDGVLLFLPLAAAVVVAAVVANLMVSGWVFSPKALEFNFSKLNPITEGVRIFV
ncbi:MAG: EscU/YscU/HrcU family type III secretion system export apparatus switch protein [Betaproteobacteria bacterium]|nr:EscU/YscU/HrcU family type III secretion system export apparatus switch protein [Betaproteobacteria bacterium]